MDELTPEQKFAAEDPGIIVARGLLHERSHERIAADLRELDWDPYDAWQLILHVERDLARFLASEDSRRRMREEARADRLSGLVLLGLGGGLAVLGGVFLWWLKPVWVVIVGSLALGGVPGTILLARGQARGRMYALLDAAVQARRAIGDQTDSAASSESVDP
jgi:hypothetical protein